MADIKQMQINGQLYEVPGNGDVSKDYVDQRDTQVLADAKAYAGGKASEAQSAAITHADNQDAQTLAAANQHSDEQDAQTLAAAKAYTDEHSSSYVLPAATRTELGGIKAAPAQAGDTKGVYIGDDQMLHVTPDVLVVQATKEGGSWVADVGSETIRSFGGNAIIKAEVEGVQYVYQYQRYDSARGAVFDQANLQPDAIERIEVIVDRSRNITIVRTPYTPPVQSTTAVCHDEAAPQSITPNIWYVSKDLPKPSATVGLIVDVYWEHGRVDDLGYDVKLIWGAPDDPDNELILDQTNTSDPLVGDHSIPVRGTVRYQLVESNGRTHWQYVSGPVIPRQFSSATEAATADKAVPGMQLSYIPGEEIFVQLDDGNTAAVARIVPDEGPTLPIYGNGEGAKTGEIPAGYILQLKNAGGHWQIINSPGNDGNGVTKEQAVALNNMFKVCAFTSPDVTEQYKAFKFAFGLDVPIPATKVTLSPKVLSFVSSKAQTLKATVEPSDTTDTVMWESNHPNIASVVNGVVTPVNNGDCVITARAGSASDTCAVNVALSSIQKYTVTNQLTNCKTSNSTAEVSENQSYAATITADDGYTMTGATVSIKMGNTDISGSAYHDGQITISKVTGNLIVKIVSVKEEEQPDIPNGIAKQGLKFYLDGKNRGGVPGNWKDVITGLDMEMSGVTESENAVEFAGNKDSYCTYKIAQVDESPYYRFFAPGTIEVTFEPASGGSKQYVLFSPVAPVAPVKPDGADQLTMGRYNDEIVVTSLNPSKSPEGLGRKSFLHGGLLDTTKMVSVSVPGDNCYINGAKITDRGANNWFSTYLLRLNVGTGWSKYFFKGKIYAVRIYDRVLTEAEILKNQQTDAARYGGASNV